MSEMNAIFHISGTTSDKQWSDRLVLLRPIDKKAEIEILGYKIIIEKNKEQKNGSTRTN